MKKRKRTISENNEVLKKRKEAGSVGKFNEGKPWTPWDKAAVFYEYHRGDGHLAIASKYGRSWQACTKMISEIRRNVEGKADRLLKDLEMFEESPVECRKWKQWNVRERATLKKRAKAKQALTLERFAPLMGRPVESLKRETDRIFAKYGDDGILERLEKNALDGISENEDSKDSRSSTGFVLSGEWVDQIERLPEEWKSRVADALADKILNGLG